MEVGHTNISILHLFLFIEITIILTVLVSRKNIDLAKYNKITLKIIPLTILAAVITVCIVLGIMYLTTVFDNKIPSGDNIETSELYTLTEIESEDKSYILYGTQNNYITASDTCIIAFEGEDLNKIKDTVDAGADNEKAFVTVTNYCNKDNMYTKDFSMYIDNIDVPESNEQLGKELIQRVQVYNINDYIGYKDNSADFAGILVSAGLILVISIGITFIIIEILVTLLLRFTLLRNKFTKES